MHGRSSRAQCLIGQQFGQDRDDPGDIVVALTDADPGQVGNNKIDGSGTIPGCPEILVKGQHGFELPGDKALVPGQQLLIAQLRFMYRVAALGILAQLFFAALTYGPPS